jgi:acyl transferase domain-containing protein
VVRISAATPASLASLVSEVKAVLERDTSALDPIADELNHRRKDLPYRAAVAGHDAGEIASALGHLGQPETARRVRWSGPAVFAFGGQGDIDTTALCALLMQEDFAAHLHRAAVDLAPDERSWLEGATHIDEASTLQTNLVQPLLYGFQTFVIDQFTDAGVSPAVVVGHGVGEIAALYAAGVISLAGGMAFATRRGAAMQRSASEGAMASVHSDVVTVTGLLTTGVVVAAENSADSCVIAGPHKAIEGAIGELHQHGIRSRRLPVTRAFHSPLMTAAADEMAQLCTHLRLVTPRVPLVSTLTGRHASLAELTDPSYWRDQAVQRVRFRDALRCVSDGYPAQQVWFDISFTPAVTHLIRAEQSPRHNGCLTVGPSAMAQAGVPGLLAQAWSLGLDISPPARRAPAAQRYVLPYPFDRHSYWIEPQPPTESGQMPTQTSVEPASPGDPPKADEILAVVLAAWCDALGLAEVDPAAEFFEVGGHSLAMIALMEELERLFPTKRLPRMREFLVDSTPRAMAGLIGKAVNWK